jgi:hypothetical protein
MSSIIARAAAGDVPVSTTSASRSPTMRMLLLPVTIVPADVA